MIRLRTFGGLSLEAGGETLAAGNTRRRRVALLAVLAAAGPRGVSRDRLLALFWPESDAEQARHALNQALYVLRRELRAPGPLVHGTADLALNLDVVTSDIGDFTDALERGDFETAIGVYRGPFLDGVFLDGLPDLERSIETARSHLAHRLHDALLTLAHGTQDADPQRAVFWWQEIARLDPLDAEGALGLMRALVAVGDSAGALRHAYIYERLLRDQLEVAPDPRIVALAADVRVGAAEGPSLPRLPALQPPGLPLQEPARTCSDGFPGAGDTRLPQAVADGTSRVPEHHADVAVPADRSEAADDVRAPHPPSPPRRLDHEGNGSDALLISRREVRPIREAEEARTPAWARRAAVGTGVLGLALLATAVIVRTSPSRERPAVLAVGVIHDFTGVNGLSASGLTGGGRLTPPGGFAAPVRDLLATNLSRVPLLQVVSAARLYEVLGQLGARGDTSEAPWAIARAARRAGASELIEGALYQRPTGMLRLDVRRVSLARGAILESYSVEGPDPFTVVDHATDAIAASLGRRPEALHVTDVTTRSFVAYRFYQEGLRTWYEDGDVRGARRFFAAATAEDSAFALAAHEAAWADRSLGSVSWAQVGRVLRLAERAPERDRLAIRASWSAAMGDPARLFVAETLVAHYPLEPEGHLWVGDAKLWAGDFLGARAELQRVVLMDSSGSQGSKRCHACDAYADIALAYALADSLSAAERVAREWQRMTPRSIAPWDALAVILEYAGQYEASFAVRQREEALEEGRSSHRPYRITIALRRGDFLTVDSLIRQQLAGTTVPEQAELLWHQTMSLWYQGRLHAALVAARKWRDAMWQAGDHAHVARTPFARLLEAVILCEAGDARHAIELFGALAHPMAGDTVTPPGLQARHVAWNSTHLATAVARAGDTARLLRLIDSIRIAGSHSQYGRDQRLHHYARGLLYVRRAMPESAAAAFRQSLWSSTQGYSRASVDLARVLLQLGRPDEAVAVLQPTLRGPLDASNGYVSRTDIHEALGRAFDLGGHTDSAVTHYRFVADAWRRADPEFRPRRARVLKRLAALHGVR